MFAEAIFFDKLLWPLLVIAEKDTENTKERSNFRNLNINNLMMSE
jgi:hypothetical protein